MDVKVDAIGKSSRSHETIIQNASNIIDARDQFARQKGYKNYGDMVASYRDKGKDKPPYSFTKVRG